MEKVRVMHFLNQYFAGFGGEEKADVPLSSLEGAVGPGKRLQVLLGDSAEIVVTTYCGDNCFAENSDKILGEILQIARKHDVAIVVAGPAFNAGRYGFACDEVCHFLTSFGGLPCVSGMFVENPGLDGYRQYKDKEVFILPTSNAITGMEDALSRMAKFILKLGSGLPIGPAAEEGYIPRSIRVDKVAGKSGAQRAIDMLIDRLAGRPFQSEIPMESLEKIPVPPAISDLGGACIALATSAGVVPAGNPDGFKIHKNRQWAKYPVDKLGSMKDEKWEVMHGGINTVFITNNANYAVPLDACRELEKERVFAKLYPYFYGTTGVGGLASDMQAMAGEMVSDLKAEGVDGVLLVST